MGKLTTKDVVLISAMQFAVAVAGMLLIRRWEETFVSSEMQAPFPVSVLADFGFLTLALPLGWLAWMWRVRGPSVLPGARIRAFVGGLAIALAIALVFGCAVARAWLVHAQMIDARMADFFHL